MTNPLILRYDGRIEYVLYRPKVRQAVFMTFDEIISLRRVIQHQDLSVCFARSIRKDGSAMADDEFSRRVFQNHQMRFLFVDPEPSPGQHDCRQNPCASRRRDLD